MSAPAATEQPLSPKEELFVAEYLIDLNGTRAYKRAGFIANKNSAAVGASRLLRKPNVAAAIRKAMDGRKSALKMSADEVLEQLTKIGRSNIKDLMTWGKEGVTLKHSAKLSRDQTCLIAELSETETLHGGSLKLKLHDKVKALHLLGQYHKLFTEKFEGSTPDGKPFAFFVPVTATPEQWEQMIAAPHGSAQ